MIGRDAARGFHLTCGDIPRFSRPAQRGKHVAVVQKSVQKCEHVFVLRAQARLSRANAAFWPGAYSAGARGSPCSHSPFGPQFCTSPPSPTNNARKGACKTVGRKVGGTGLIAASGHQLGPRAAQARHHCRCSRPIGVGGLEQGGDENECWAATARSAPPSRHPGGLSRWSEVRWDGRARWRARKLLHTKASSSHVALHEVGAVVCMRRALLVAWLCLELRVSPGPPVLCFVFASTAYHQQVGGGGSVLTRGAATCCDDCSAVQDRLKNVRQIQASVVAFAAILGDGSVVTWGHVRNGGDSRPCKIS